MAALDWGAVSALRARLADADPMGVIAGMAVMGSPRKSLIWAMPISTVFFAPSHRSAMSPPISGAAYTRLL
mgnify:CR=1 FL=1